MLMRFLSVGECMVELSGTGEPGLWRQGFAGDTFNTAWYARMSLPTTASVGYLTCVGHDPISDAMLDFMAGAAIDTGDITRHPSRAPGLYMIDLRDGERSFTYWRDSSAARNLADDPNHLAEAFSRADLVYFSGITLAILSPDRRRALLGALALTDARVAFDPNLRPRLWAGEDEMRDWIMHGAAVADIALPSFADEADHFGDADIEATAMRYLRAGPSEIVVKNGGDRMLGHLDGQPVILPAPRRLHPVDTTGAGDSFNGGYLAARMRGADLPQAVEAGHELASRVIGWRGALMPMST